VNEVTHPRLSLRRGAARATSWWGKAWVRAVEESAYGDRELRAARALARSGRIGSIAVRPGGFVASVPDGDDVFTPRVTVPVLDASGVTALVDVVAAESGRVAALLAGELPYRLIEEAEEAGVELLPYGGELGADCTCDHWLDPCVHALAVGYQVAWLTDADPLVLIALRGLPREELLARLHARPSETRAPGESGARPEAGSPPADEDTAMEAALRAARILDLGESAPDALF
jgi:uncharacterized Zn finger protein